MMLNRDIVKGLERKHYRYLSNIAKYVSEYVEISDNGDIFLVTLDRSQDLSRLSLYVQETQSIKHMALQLRKDKEDICGTGKSGLVIGFCTDCYMLSKILTAHEVQFESFRRTSTEYIYIKINGVYLIQSDKLSKDEQKSLHENKIKEIIETGILGLTTASEIRNRISKEFDKSKWDHERIAALYFGDFKVYSYIMHTLYRGGTCFCKKGEYEDVDMWDMDSAHIRQMLIKKYPTSSFNVVEAANLANVKTYCDCGYAVICSVTFKNLKSKLGWCGIESKARKDDITLLDCNRHIIKSDCATVTLNEIDLKIYDMIYAWSEAKVNFCMIAKKNPLPAFLRKVVLNLYLDKETLKKANKDYTNEKKRVNMTYGACATKFDCRTYDREDNIDNAYYEHKKRSELSPLWAIWTAAYTRLAQCELLIKSEDVALYGDTDSVYTLKSSHKRIKAVVENINSLIYDENVKAKIPERIGMWELKSAKKLKVIGAKQYAYIDDAGTTIIKSAGIAKNALKNVTYDDYNRGLVVRAARRHIEYDNADKVYKYVYDDVAVGDAVKIDELNYFVKRMYNKY